MEKEETNKCPQIYKFLNQPIIIAIISTLIFGGVVSWLGSKFQYNNLKNIQEISFSTAQYEKIFDKRAEIVKNTFFQLLKQEHNIWDRFRSYNAYKDVRDLGKTNIIENIANDLKQWDDIDREIALETTALFEEIKIYFDMSNYSEFLYNYKNITDQYRELIDQINENKGIERNTLETKMNDINTLKDKMHQISNELVYNLKITDCIND